MAIPHPLGFAFLRDTGEVGSLSPQLGALTAAMRPPAPLTVAAALNTAPRVRSAARAIPAEKAGGREKCQGAQQGSWVRKRRLGAAGLPGALKGPRLLSMDVPPPLPALPLPPAPSPLPQGPSEARPCPQAQLTGW